MSVRVRLTRVGSKKNAAWRVVVADQRSPRDGRIIESIGHYDPQTDPSTVVIDRERLEHWVKQGARPTNTVRKLIRAPNTEAPQVARAAESESAPELETPPPAQASEAPEVEATADPGEAGDVSGDPPAEPDQPEA